MPILYQNSPGVLCSRWFSGLKTAAFGRGFRYRIGIGFVAIVVQNLSGYWMDPIPIPYQTALLKLVFLVQILRKIALTCKHPENFEENRAPLRSILKI